MADILADNQTESGLTPPDGGEADEATRDRVPAGEIAEHIVDALKKVP